MARLCVDRRSRWMLPSQEDLVAPEDKVEEVVREAEEAQVEEGVVLMGREVDMVALGEVMVVAEVVVEGVDQEELLGEDMVEKEEAEEDMEEREVAEEDKTMDINNLHTKLIPYSNSQT